MTELLLLAAMLDARGLERMELESGCRAEGTRVVCEFAAPKDLGRKHVRLETACRDGVRVNGISIRPDEGGLALTPYLSSRGMNRVSFGAECRPAALLVTPRVFLASIRAEPATGQPLALIENTLENTVSVSVACRAPGAEWSASGTVGAGSVSELALAGPAMQAGRVACELEKSTEAVEESYTYRVDLSFQPLTKNGRPNIR